MFSRYDNPEHPANRGHDTEKHRHAINDMYVRMDDLVGRVQSELNRATCCSCCRTTASATSAAG